MLKPEFSGQFKRDYKLAIKRGCDPKKLEEVITLLCNEQPLPEAYRDHALTNSRNYKDMRECHIEPDWLLVYKVVRQTLILFQSTPSAWRETAKLHRKAFFISPILVQSCKKGCKRLHSAPEKMVFFEKREKNLVRNLQHLSVRL